MTRDDGKTSVSIKTCVFCRLDIPIGSCRWVGRTEISIAIGPVSRASCRTALGIVPIWIKGINLNNRFAHDPTKTARIPMDIVKLVIASGT